MSDRDDLKKSDLERAFETQVRQMELPDPETQYRFAARAVGLGPGIRKRLKAAGLQDWRFDFAWPLYDLAVECEGGTWMGGGHVRGSGYERDCRKYNHAAELGWLVFRFTSNMIKSGEAIEQVARIINCR